MSKEYYQCPYCREILGETNNFCPRCGNKAEKPELGIIALGDDCPRCGYEPLAKDFYCIRCGARLKDFK